jgi:hypothetical protein
VYTLTQEYQEVGTGVPIEKENLVEFRLLFQGEIGSDSRAPVKQAIRRAMHPQLRRLWTVNRRLRELSEHRGRMVHARLQEQAGQSPTYPPQHEAIEFAFQHWGDNWNYGPFRFVPLVTKELAAVCSLDILLLRPDDDTHVMEHGDLDGHVKTLFDGLRMPTSQSETANSFPTEDENPFYCLLEDDRLVSELRVKADKLLILPNKTKSDKNDAFAVITVKINHKYPGTFDQWFA